MGRFRQAGADRVRAIATGTFTAAGPGSWIDITGSFNLWISGAVGRLALEASFDGGATAIAELGDDRLPLELVGPQRLIIDEVEIGVLYRLVCLDLPDDSEIHWRASK